MKIVIRGNSIHFTSVYFTLNNWMVVCSFIVHTNFALYFHCWIVTDVTMLPHLLFYIFWNNIKWIHMIIFIFIIVYSKASRVMLLLTPMKTMTNKKLISLCFTRFCIINKSNEILLLMGWVMILQPFTRDPSWDDVHYRCHCKHYQNIRNILRY